MPLAAWASILGAWRPWGLLLKKLRAAGRPFSRRTRCMAGQERQPIEQVSRRAAAGQQLGSSCQLGSSSQFQGKNYNKQSPEGGDHTWQNEGQADSRGTHRHSGSSGLPAQNSTWVKSGGGSRMVGWQQQAGGWRQQGVVAAACCC